MPLDARRARRLRGRRQILVHLCLAATWFFVALKGRLLPPVSFGYDLYRWHDEVYLPFKGYLYTLGYPSSLSVWLVAALAGGFALWAAFAERPLTPSVHLRIASWAVHRAALRPLLERACRKGKDSRRGARLLAAVIEHECAAELAALDELAEGDPDRARRLDRAARVAVLRARILAHPPDEQPLQAIATLSRVLLRHGLVHGPHEPNAEVLAELRALLAGKLAARSPTPDFSSPSLLWDLACLLDLEHKALPVESWARQRQVLDGIAARRRQLDLHRRHLEEQWLAAGPEGWPETRTARPETAVHARLALDLAVLAGLRWQAPATALGFVESLEGLRFLLQALGEDGDPQLAASFADLPEPVDYRVCAVLGEPSIAADFAFAPNRASKRNKEVQR